MIVLQIPEEVWEALPEPPEEHGPSSPLGRCASGDKSCIYFYDNSGRVIQYTSEGWVITSLDLGPNDHLPKQAVSAGPFPTLDAACVAWKLGL